MGRLWGTFIKNLSSFLLALFLAIIVWVMAVNATSRIEDRIFPEVGLPIELENIPPGLVPLSGEGQRVRLHIRAPAESWVRLEPSDFRAWLDLSGLEPGLHQLEVHVEQARPVDPQVRILRRLPDRVTVRLDEVVTRTVPIEVNVSDRQDVAYSYEVLTPTVSPPEVDIRGPSSLVNQVESAVVNVELHETRSTVTANLPVTLVDRRGQPVLPDQVPGMRVEPEQALVTVPIRQRPGYRELIVRPVIVGTPAPGYWVSDVQWDPKIISVVGLPSITQELPGIVQTEPIDVTGERAGTITRSVRVILPENVSPLDQTAANVTVEIEPLTSSKTVTVEPEVTGLQPGLAVADISPGSIDVLVEGPVVELDTLRPEDVLATLDLTGRMQGTNLITPTIVPPGSLRVQSYLPEQVEVTLVEAQGVLSMTRPVTVTGVARGLRALSTPPTVTVSLAGPVLPLQELKENAITVTVDVAGRGEGTYVLTPTISSLPGITVTGVTPPQLTVDLFPAGNTIVVTRTLAWDHLGPGLVLNLVPREVAVRLRGPGDAATLTNSPQLRVSVDLDGLGPGTYTLRPQATVPPGYEFLGVTPESVRATLSRSN